MSDPTSQAKEARETLARALGALQSDPTVPPSLMSVAEPVAQAMGALHAIERTGVLSTAAAARDHVRTALGQLQTHSAQHAAVSTAMEAVAGSLGVIFGLVKLAEAGGAAAAPPAAAQPAPAQAAPVQAAPAQAYQQPAPAPAQAYQQPAPAPAPAPAQVYQPPPAQAQQPQAAFQATQQAPVHQNPAPAPAPAAAAPAGDAARFEGSLGTNSATNFYKGLSGNDVVEHGGIFIATYAKLPKINSSVAIRIALPGGYEFEAMGQVMWTRDQRGDGEMQPGFGARFTQIAAESKQLIYRYVRNREPLFHDDFLVSRRGTTRRSRALQIALTASLGWLSGAHAAGDPYQQYWTIETPRFRVHYPKNLEPVAERIADLAEDVHHRLAPKLGHIPTTVTEIVLADNTESANGSATALPFNTVRLYVTAPDDMSPLVDYDDWYLELLTHEYTHILHTDNISGVPALLNAILGKTFAPNQVQPRWILEGLAVMHESENSSAGRNRSSLFDMYLRADVLAKRTATLDKISHNIRQWPGGNLWYLYGSRFLTWINATYGDHVMRTVAADYGSQLVPFAINRSVRRATGVPYAEQHDGASSLYQGWRAHLDRLYAKQIEEAALRGGLREGKRLTHHGRVTQRPRWVPAPARRQKAVPEVQYYLEDGHSRSGFFRMPVPSAKEAWESQRDLVIRAQGNGSASFDAQGNVFFSTIEPYKRVYAFSEISRLPVGESSPEGHESARAQLTSGLRAIDPDVSADGRRVVFAINRKGTQTLAIADTLPEGGLGEPRVLVPTVRFDQAYTPRFSPDGRRVAYSVWTAGGYRDIRVVDANTGRYEEIFHDRAIDQHPSWSPDGNTLYFTSDRTGIPNVYAYDLRSKELFQITNVRTGAFMPEVADDGATMIYVGYTPDGFDLFGMTLDRAAWVPATPYVDGRPEPPPSARHQDWKRRRYDPLPTLRPRAYELSYGPGSLGQTLIVSTRGADVVGHHAFAASVMVETERADPQFSLSYSFGRLPVDLSVSLFRSFSPRTGYRINGKEPEFIEEYLGISSGLSYSVPRAFDSFTLFGGYTASRYKGSLPVGPILDPQEPATVNPVGTGMLGLLRAGMFYSNAERSLYSVGNSRGTSIQITTDAATRETASDYTFYAFNYTITNSLPMPWHKDHTLATSASSGIAGGDFPRRGVYYTGGFLELPLVDTIANTVFQGNFLLRGYPPSAFSGRQYHLGTAEYRFPIAYPERGISTLPLFLNRVSGAFFIDYGGAFDDLDVTRWRDQFHTGLGAEILIDATFGYFLGVTTRIGYAKGTSPEAYQGGKTYFVLSSPY